MANLYWPHRSDLRSHQQKARRFHRRLEQAEREATKILLITHRHCLDGAGSAIVTLRAKQGVGVMSCQPSDVQDVLERLVGVPAKGRILMIADLSLNPEHYDAIVAACERLQANGWHIEWRDHHHKQWEGLDLDRLLAHVDVLEVNADATESGASLQQQAVAPRDKFGKRLADTIKDRDLWWNKNPDSETLEFAMNHLGEDAFIQHYLRPGPNDPVVDARIKAAAHAETRRVEEHARRLLSEARYHKTSQGDKIAIVYGWLPKNVGLHRVLEKDDVEVAVNVRPNGNMSLRSRKGSDVCHLIAREFDGGGHPNASGGTLGLSGLPYWWYVMRRGRTRRVRQVAAAAVRHLEEA